MLVDPVHTSAAARKLKEAKVQVEGTIIGWIAKDPTVLPAEEKVVLDTLISRLEEDDDVTDVYTSCK